MSAGANLVQTWGMAVRILVAAAVTLMTVGVGAPAVQAETTMPSTWHSNSLRDNDIGYHFTITPVSGTSDRYTGTFRFTHRDGRRVAAVPITMVRRGDQVTFRATRGSFDRAAGPLRGVMNSRGDELTLTNCQARLRLVMSFALDSDCVFRPAVD